MEHVETEIHIQYTSKWRADLFIGVFWFKMPNWAQQLYEPYVGLFFCSDLRFFYIFCKLQQKLFITLYWVEISTTFVCYFPEVTTKVCKLLEFAENHQNQMEIRPKSAGNSLQWPEITYGLLLNLLFVYKL